jgi:hypothetical protein
VLFEEGDLVLEGDRTMVRGCWWWEQAGPCGFIEGGWFWGRQLRGTYAADGLVRWSTVFPIVDLAGSDIHRIGEERRWEGESKKSSPAA